MPWKLLASQSDHGFKPLADRAGPEQLKAIAADLRRACSDGTTIQFRIYDNDGRLRYCSVPSTSWRMRWKTPQATEYLHETYPLSKAG